MTLLDLVLLIKIVGTGAFSGLPLALLPGSMVSAQTGIGPEALPIARLYGVSIIALLVGYSFGFSGVTGGAFPWGVVAMGLVSNGLATFTLAITGFARRARGMTLLVAAITVALAFCAFNPAFATRVVW